MCLKFQVTNGVHSFGCSHCNMKSIFLAFLGGEKSG